jgi:hypothetical protein
MTVVHGATQTFRAAGGAGGLPTARMAARTGHLHEYTYKSPIPH